MTSWYAGALTDDHLEWISQVRAEWLRAGLSTEVVDRPAAEAAVRRVYETAGFQPPRAVVWVDSPYACVLAGLTLQQATQSDQLSEQLSKQLRDQLGDQPWEELVDLLGDQLSDKLDRELGDELYCRLKDRLGEERYRQLGNTLYHQLADQLWGQLSGRLADLLRAQLQELAGERTARPFGAALDAYWIAFHSLAARIVGMPSDPLLDALANADRRLGWWIPTPAVAIVSERPTALHFDDQGRLHNPSGPAVAYVDGWGVWAWHGVRVEPWVITNPTPEAIAAEPNAEVRRAAIEVLGWDAYIRQATLALVGEADDPGNPGQRLALLDVPEHILGGPVRLLVCTNGTVERDGTRRRYGLTVPATISDPVQAAGWTYGLTRDQYAQLRRRT